MEDIRSQEAVIPTDSQLLDSLNPTKRRMVALLGTPLAIFFANLYLEAPWGFHAALFWPAFLALSLWFFSPQVRWKDPMFLVSLMGVLAGSVHSALYASEAMKLLNFAGLPLLSVFCLIVAIRPNDGIFFRHLGQALFQLFLAPFISVFKIPRFLASKDEKVKQRSGSEVITGLVLLVPLLLCLLILLTQADFGFSQILRGLTSRLEAFSLSEAMIRTTLSLFALIYFLCLIIGLRLQSGQKIQEAPLPFANSDTIPLILLAGVDGLYALFTLSQLRSLYFPMEQLTAESLTVSQYARNGFFSLLLILFINLILLWLVSRFRSDQKILPKVLIGLLILFTANLILSSFYKMSLYQATYGFTHLRLFVFFSLGFFSLALLLTTAFFFGRVKNLVAAYASAAILTYLVMNLVNLDGLIVAKAKDIYLSQGRLDSFYLEDLSADGYRAFQDHFEPLKEDPAVQKLTRNYINRLSNKLANNTKPLSRTLTELSLKP